MKIKLEATEMWLMEKDATEQAHETEKTHEEVFKDKQRKHVFKKLY